MRKKIAAGNWKMNTDLNSGTQLVNEIIQIELGSNVEVILGVPFTHLQAIQEIVSSKNGFFTAAQNCSEHVSGAYTGEVSAEMIKSIGVDYIILGHSERRGYFSETDEVVAEKIDRALESGLKVIYCCGEKLNSRKEGKHIEVVSDQIKKALSHLDANQLKNIVIAYEPVWAIGTGETASPEQAQEMHAAIRVLISNIFSQNNAELIPILYGGSCNPNNAQQLFSQPDVDGGLVGGASLRSESFISIIKALK